MAIKKMEKTAKEMKSKKDRTMGKRKKGFMKATSSNNFYNKNERIMKALNYLCIIKL